MKLGNFNINDEAFAELQKYYIKGIQLSREKTLEIIKRGEKDLKVEKRRLKTIRRIEAEKQKQKELERKEKEEQNKKELELKRKKVQ